MKSRAAVAWEAGKPLIIEEIDVEGPKAGEVLVRIHTSGVNPSDVKKRAGAFPNLLDDGLLCFRCARRNLLDDLFGKTEVGPHPDGICLN